MLSDDLVAHRHTALWLVSLAAVITWQLIIGGGALVDTISVVVAHALALPIITACRRRPAMLPLLGCAILGACDGLCLVDIAFDVEVLKSQESWPAAWQYYHLLLNSPIINCSLLLFLLLASFGAWIGAEDALSPDGDAATRQTWRTLVILCSTTIPLYLFVVVPKYLGIRAGTAIDKTAFQGWAAVLAVRVVLVTAMTSSVALCMRLALRKCDDVGGIMPRTPAKRPLSRRTRSPAKAADAKQRGVHEKIK